MLCWAYDAAGWRLAIQMLDTNRTIGIAFAVSAALVWGAVYTIDQELLSGTSAVVLLFVDSIVTALLVLPIAVTKHQALRDVLHAPGKTLALVLLSIVLAALANYFIFSGIQFAGAPTASIFEVLYPVFVTVLAWMLFGQRPTLTFAVGAAFVVLGAALILAQRQ